MARISLDEVESYRAEGSGDINFFKLVDDRDTARVRFMYEDVSEVVGYLVHKIEVGGKNRQIECLRTHDQPKEDCPLCAAGNVAMVKFYVPLYDVKTKEAKLWERGKTFHKTLDSLCRRYVPLVSTVIEIERNGKKGDQKTTYGVFEDTKAGEEGVTLADLPEIPTPDGLVMNKSFAEIEDFMETGEFPESGTPGRKKEADTGPGVRRPRVEATETTGRRTKVDRDF